MTTRRNLLRSIGGTLAVASAGALAGCPGNSGGGDGNSGDTPEPGSGPGYANGLYDPSAVLDASVHGFVTYDLATLYERRDIFPDEFVSQLESFDDQYDAVSIADATRFTGQAYTSSSVEELRGMSGREAPPAGGTALVEGSFQPDTIVDRLRESSDGEASIEEVGSTGGYTLYSVEASGSPPATLALSEESVGLGATTPPVEASSESAVRTMVEAQGGGSGYYDAGGPMQRLMDTLGEGTMTGGVAGNFDPLFADSQFPNDDIEAVLLGLRAVGSTATLADETLTNTIAGVYADGEAPSEDTVQSALDWLDEQLEDADSVPISPSEVDVSVDGRTVTASLSRGTEDLFGGDATQPAVGGMELLVVLFFPILGVVFGA